MARVLVVDDENLMRTMVEVACRRLGHEALCAATLAEGRRLAAEQASLLLPAHLATGLRVAVARSRAGKGRVAGDVPGGREVCPPLAEAGACSVPDLPPMPETGRAFPSLRSWRHEAERHYVARVRALCGDDARAAARMAGVSRGHWYELLKKYGF